MRAEVQVTVRVLAMPRTRVDVLVQEDVRVLKNAAVRESVEVLVHVAERDVGYTVPPPEGGFSTHARSNLIG